MGHPVLSFQITRSCFDHMILLPANVWLPWTGIHMIAGIILELHISNILVLLQEDWSEFISIFFAVNLKLFEYTFILSFN